MTDIAAHPDTQADLTIRGMSCAGCVSRVGGALEALPGVREASVNLALGTARVTLAADGPAPATLAAAVEAAGFGAEVIADAAQAPDRDVGPPTWRLAVAFVVAAPFLVMMLGMAIGAEALHLGPWTQLALGTVAQTVVAWPFLKGAWHATRARAGSMDQLVALGTTAAYVHGAAIVLLGLDGALYFEAAAVILALVLLGKALEARATRGTTQALRALMALRPDTALVVTADGTAVPTPVAEVVKGARVRIGPGSQVPVDGRIAGGETEIDEAAVTGESLPVLRGVGDRVIAGTTNGTGVIEIEATAVGADTTLARIVRLVANAQAGRAPVQRLVDKVAGMFVPAVLLLALVTAVGWLLAGEAETALVAAVSVLVIACPCALGLATPTALVTGMGVAARHGILVRDVAALEVAHRVDTVVFDKTGTVTAGTPRLVGLDPFNGWSADAALALAAGLQAGGTHPLATATLEAADAIEAAAVAARRARPGKGVTGTAGGVAVALGTIDLVPENALTAPVLAALAAADAAGETSAILAHDGAAVAVLRYADTLKPGAAEAVAALQRDGIAVHLLSGDRPAAVAAVAEPLGIPAVEAAASPERKAAYLAALSAEGRTVAMVGDGINDAPALAAADIGIAIGGGTDVALETAGVTLMRGDPRTVAAALAVGRATWTTLRRNLFWAFGYNVLALPVAALGLLNPAVAGAAMALSSVSVVLSALSLRRWRPARR